MSKKIGLHLIEFGAFFCIAAAICPTSILRALVIGACIGVIELVSRAQERAK